MRRRVLLGWVLGILAVASSVALLLTSAWLITRAAEHPPVLYLMVAIVGVRACGVARAGFRYAERLVTHDAALRLLVRVRVRTYRRLERLAPAGLGSSRRGDVVSRVVGDVDAHQDLLLRATLPWSVNLFVTVATAGLVWWVHPAAGAVLAAAVGTVLVLAPVLVCLAGRRNEQQVAPLRGELAATVAQAVRAAPDVIAYGASETAMQQVRRTDASLCKAQRRTAWLAGLGSGLVRTTVGLAVCGTAMVALPDVRTGALEPVLFAVVVLAPVALLEPLDAMPAVWQQWIRARAALARLVQITDRPDPVAEPETDQSVGVGFALEVRALDAGWGTGPTVIRGLDLDVPEGAVVAVTGVSGSGKSTLAQVLLRMLEPRSGSVTLGGAELSGLTGESVRSVVGLLGQDEHVFDTTVRENLRIADPAADEQRMRAVLERAGLWDFVRSLPAGLDTYVGENGNRMSGGERQRLGLARILLGEHHVLVLDEPTEHLDRETASALTADLFALAPGRSLILVTHDQEAAGRCDAIVELQRHA